MRARFSRPLFKRSVMGQDLKIARPRRNTPSSEAHFPSAHSIAATREGPKVCRLPAGGSRIRTIGPSRTTSTRMGLSTWEGEIPRDTDSPLEGDGFEPSVPLLRKALLGVTNRRRRHERWSHLQVRVRNGNAFPEW